MQILLQLISFFIYSFLYIFYQKIKLLIFSLFLFKPIFKTFFLLLDDYAYFPPFSMKFDYFYSLFTENVVIDQLKVGLYPYYLLKQLFRRFVLQSPKYPKMVHAASSTSSNIQPTVTRVLLVLLIASLSMTFQQHKQGICHAIFYYIIPNINVRK